MVRISRYAREQMYSLFSPSFSPKVYHDRLQKRSVQEKIVHFLTFDQNNYGFVFATSLGKTIIDVLVTDILLERGVKKILVTAPSVELCRQIYGNFSYYRQFDKGELVMMAALNSQKRQNAWRDETARVYFTTPQNVVNDIRKGLSSDYFQVVFFDEAHHGVGDYEYVFLGERLYRHAKIIAQTATPGSKVKREEVKKALHLKDWYSVPLPEQFSWQMPISQVERQIKLNSNWQEIWDLMKVRANHYYTELFETISKYDRNDQFNEKFTYLSQKDNLAIGKMINYIKQVDYIDFGRSAHAFSLVQKMARWAKYLFSENFEIAARHFTAQEKDKSKSGKRLYKENLDLHKEITSLSKKIIYPKLSQLEKILGENADNQIMIFQNYVESISIVQKYLLKWGYTSKFLIGKSHSKIQKAKETILVASQFKRREFNLLQATQVGMEGLHFPYLDTIVFLSILETSESMLQAYGRIGRTKGTDAAYAILFGEFDNAFYYANQSKILKMFDGIKNIPDIYVSKSRVAKTDLPKRKNKFMSSEVYNLNGRLIRERFFVEDVRKMNFDGRIKLLFRLRDKSGYISALISIAGDKVSEIKKYMSFQGRVVIVSGSVSVKEVSTSKTACVDIEYTKSRIRKSDIIVCPEGCYNLSDYKKAKKRSA